MSRLARELSRLYLLDATLAPSPPPSLGRVVVLALARPADWSALSQVWRGVQADLNLPAPAIAVSGTDAFQLWFSLAEPVPLHVAAGFAQALAERYLPQAPAQAWQGRVSWWPHTGPDTAKAPLASLPTVPSPTTEGQWSAFVAPDLAPVFEDTPWLDIPPSDEGQADLLATLKCMQPEAFERACQALGVATSPEPQAEPLDAPAPETCHMGPPAGPKPSPQAFLLQVMHDPSVPLALRIEAAKALLPLGDKAAD